MRRRNPRRHVKNANVSRCFDVDNVRHGLVLFSVVVLRTLSTTTENSIMTDHMSLRRTRTFVHLCNRQGMPTQDQQQQQPCSVWDKLLGNHAQNLARMPTKQQTHTRMPHTAVSAATPAFVSPLEASVTSLRNPSAPVLCR